jgi:hypothetical protein
MSVPTGGAYAVEYSLWLYDESGGTVETAVSLQFPLADASQTPYMSAQQAAEDAAAEAAMDAWRASMQAAYPSVPVHASRRYLIRADGDAWPSA